MNVTPISKHKKSRFDHFPFQFFINLQKTLPYTKTGLTISECSFRVLFFRCFSCAHWQNDKSHQSDRNITEYKCIRVEEFSELNEQTQQSRIHNETLASGETNKSKLSTEYRAGNGFIFLKSFLCLMWLAGRSVGQTFAWFGQLFYLLDHICEVGQ